MFCKTFNPHFGNLALPITILLMAGNLLAADRPGYTDTPFLPGSNWRVHDRDRPQAPVVAPGREAGQPPADAIVLFDGRNLDQWAGTASMPAKAAGIEDGAINILKTGELHTKRAFGDCQLHVEWATPAKADGGPMIWGNSGILFLGKYELQIIESHDCLIYADGIAGAIYGQTPPLVNVARKPGEWQSYDIVFTAPRFEGKRVLRPAYFSAYWNGVLVQDHVASLGPTKHRAVATYDDFDSTGPVTLQYHNSAVRFRNIWIRPLEVKPVSSADDRTLLWLDVCEGEPADDARVIEDLGKARVVYLGERHTVERHHATQAKVIAELAHAGASLVVGLEPLEASQQPSIDRFNRGEIDFDGLAAAIDWAKRWPNYKQYRPVLEAAHNAKAPVIGLSPGPEIIHAVARSGGVDRLSADLRKQLPAEMVLKDSVYEKILSAQLMVHMAASPERLRPMIEAQIARDEAMSAALADYLRSPPGRGRKAVVVCGSGHVAYGLGTPQRVRRRLGDANDRIVVLSECGDVRLSPEEMAAARAVEIPHELLRQVGRPIADYLEIACPP
jgi:uncharacterized iron-regulated protein